MRWRDNEKAFEFTVLLRKKTVSRQKNNTYTILSSVQRDTFLVVY